MTQGQKRPGNTIGEDVMVAKIATGEIEDTLPSKTRNGGLKGGEVRAKELSPERRSEIARQAAETRWDPTKRDAPMKYQSLREEFEFYRANQDEMVKQYDGRVIVLKNHEILDVYDSHLAAFVETVKYHERGTFLVQKVSEGAEAYTAILSSPGVVAG